MAICRLPQNHSRKATTCADDTVLHKLGDGPARYEAVSCPRFAIHRSKGKVWQPMLWSRIVCSCSSVSDSMIGLGHSKDLAFTLGWFNRSVSTRFEQALGGSQGSPGSPICDFGSTTCISQAIDCQVKEESLEAICFREESSASKPHQLISMLYATHVKLTILTALCQASCPNDASRNNIPRCSRLCIMLFTLQRFLTSKPGSALI